jgi:hypothetical protein
MSCLHRQAVSPRNFFSSRTENAKNYHDEWKLTLHWSSTSVWLISSSNQLARCSYVCMGRGKAVASWHMLKSWPCRCRDHVQVDGATFLCHVHHVHTTILPVQGRTDLIRLDLDRHKRCVPCAANDCEAVWRGTAEWVDVLAASSRLSGVFGWLPRRRSAG